MKSKQMSKRGLALLLVLVMCLGLLPGTALAAEENVVAEGSGILYEEPFTNQYTDLSAAINAPGVTRVKLLANITLTAGLTVSKTLELDLNGFALSGGDVTLINEGNLTIKGEASGSRIVNESKYAIANNGTLELNGGNYVGKRNAIQNNQQGVVTVQSGSFSATDDSKDTRGAILNDGNVTIVSGSFAGRHSVVNQSGVTQILGGTFQGTESDISRTGGVVDVRGGEFTQDVSEFCPANFSAVKNSDGRFIIRAQTVENSEAKVNGADGDVYFATLQQAINKAGNGQTVTLLQNVEQSVTVAQGQNIILDLNGKTLTGTTTHTLVNSGILTIQDSAFAAASGDESAMGKIVGVNVGGSPKIALYNNHGATCTIRSGMITRAPYLDGTVQDNVRANSNYTVCNAGTMRITGGLIVNNSSKSSMVINLNNQGGGIYGQNENVSMEISGGTLRQDTYTALKNDPNGEMLIKDGAEIINGDASSYVTQFYGNVTIQGGSFTGGQIWACSHADAQGGYPTTVTITGGTMNVSEIRAIYGYTKTTDPASGKVTIAVGDNASITCPTWLEQKYDVATNQCVTNTNKSASEIVLTGGTFSTDAVKKYCASGYTVAEADGQYAVVPLGETNSTARITKADGTVKYYNTTLQNVMATAETGDTVTLLSDLTAVTVSGNKSAQYVSIQAKKITLDLNGHTISGGYLWSYGAGAALTIQDSSAEEAGRINGTTYGARASKGGELTVKSGTVSGKSYGIVLQTGTANIKGGTVSGVNGILVQTGTVNMTGGLVEGDKTGISTDVKDAKNGVITISGGEVRSNATDPKDNTTGAVNAMYGAKLTVSGTAKLTGSYSGVSVWDDGSEFIMEGGSVSGAEYGVAGNGSGDTKNTMILKAGTIESNGVAVYHPQGGTLVIGVEQDHSGPVIHGGSSGVQMCAGESLTIYGGTITVTGKDYTKDPDRGTYTSGRIPDGAAVSVIARDYPSGGPTQVVITGGAFTSEQGKALYAYTWSGEENAASDWDNGNADAKRIQVSGGTFTDEILPEYCAQDYLPVTKGEKAHTVEKAALALAGETAMNAGDTQTLTVTPENVNGLTWTTSDETIATVKNGVVTAVAGGKATITAAVAGQTASIEITVTVPVTGVTLNQTEAALNVGQTLTLTAAVAPENASDKTVTWTTSSEAVATVENGVVTAVAAGTVTITATVGGQSAACQITVTVPVTGVTLNQTEAALNVGQALTLTAAVAPENASDKTVTWTTSSEAVATVENGVVTAVAAGTVTITATVGGQSAACVVTVRTPAPVNPDPGPSGGDVIITPDPGPILGGALPFDDVQENDWFYDAIKYVYDEDLMNGTSDNFFSPFESTSRGMIATILWRLEGEPEAAAASFSDVAADQWYTDAVAWAESNGIVKGYGDGTYRPEKSISRQELAAILYRYTTYKGYHAEKRADLSAYTDAGVITWAMENVQWAVAEGIITGKTSTTLLPEGLATRAEAATMLMRFCENVAGK